MAAVIRRHWGMVFAVLLAALIAGGWLILLRQTHGQATGGPPDAGGQTGIEPSLYAQVDGVRRELRLGSEELAAMGCTQENTEQVLQALLNWCQSNKAALDQADRACLQGQSALQETVRLINVGPRNQALIDQVPVQQQQIVSTREQRRQLIEAAIPSVSEKFNAAQNQVWQTVRSNRRASGRYRYAPDITQEQLRAIDPAVVQCGADSAQVQALEQQVLSAGQRAAIEQAITNRQQNLAGTLAAQGATLPQNQDLAAPVAAD